MKIVREGLRLSRWREWAQSKLPFIAGGALLLTPRDSSPHLLLLALASVAAWAAFGYAINDFADRATDRAAGKTNRAASMSGTSAAGVILVTGGVALGLAPLWSPDGTATILVATGLALSAAYSMPPFRLKERGGFGLVAAAAAQWSLPVLAVAEIEPHGWSTPAAGSIAALGFAIGLRWIGVHQLQDLAADRRAGVRTYALMGGGVGRLIEIAFGGEAFLLGLALAFTWPRSAPAALALGCWMALVEIPRLRRETLESRLRSYTAAPLREFYFALMPASLVSGRLLASPVAGLLVAVALSVSLARLARRIDERGPHSTTHAG